MGRWHALKLIRPETQHGLGRHILAVTPEMFERLLKVGGPSESNPNRAAEDRSDRSSSIKGLILFWACC